MVCTKRLKRSETGERRLRAVYRCVWFASFLEQGTRDEPKKPDEPDPCRERSLVA
jgi:hypothetical protein